MNCPAAIQAGGEMKSQHLKARDRTTGEKPQWCSENASQTMHGRRRNHCFLIKWSFWGFFLPLNPPAIVAQTSTTPPAAPTFHKCSIIARLAPQCEMHLILPTIPQDLNICNYSTTKQTWQPPWQLFLSHRQAAKPLSGCATSTVSSHRTGRWKSASDGFPCSIQQVKDVLLKRLFDSQSSPHWKWELKTLPHST